MAEQAKEPMNEEMLFEQDRENLGKLQELKVVQISS